MTTVVIGIGNPHLADDSVGLDVVRRVAERAGVRRDVTFQELHTGGLALMEAMAGHRRAIVVDAVESGSAPPGAVSRLHLKDLAGTRNCCSSHDASLEVALEMGARAGLRLPEQVLVWGIEAADVTTFGAPLSPEVASAAALVAGDILAELNA